MTAATRVSRWRRMPVGARTAIIAVVVLVVVNVGLGLLDAATRGADRTGARASSFSTAATGTAGYAALLERYGHPTSRARGEIRPGALDPQSVVVVLDAGRPSDEERRAVADFTDAGGRLVAGGPDATAWAGPRRGARVTWAPNGPTQAQAEVDGDSYRVHTDGHGRWRVAAGGVSPDGALTVQQSTPATVVLLADTSPLQNRRLDQADNAAFGVALAGTDHRPVVFVEGPHGFGSESGLGAIPGRWKVALVGGALAALLTLIAASRRIGPAEETVRRLPPPRRAYVDAMGVTMARARHPAEAVAPLQAAARAQVARRAGLPAGAPSEEIGAAAARLGWSAEEITALFRPASDTEGILAAGRALARAERGAP